MPDLCAFTARSIIARADGESDSPPPGIKKPFIERKIWFYVWVWVWVKHGRILRVNIGYACLLKCARVVTCVSANSMRDVRYHAGRNAAGLQQQHQFVWLFSLN